MSVLFGGGFIPSKLKKPLEWGKETKTGKVAVVPGAIVTPYRIFPFASLASVTNVAERKHTVLLVFLTINGGATTLWFLIDAFSNSSSPFLAIFFGVLTLFFGYHVARPPKTGLRLEAASGSTETILSANKEFISHMYENILLILSEKIAKNVIYNIDQSQANYFGDVAFQGGEFNKFVQESFHADNKHGK